MFMKKIFIETITIILIVGTLPVVISQNQCTVYGDPPQNSTFSLDAFASVVDLCTNLKGILAGLSPPLSGVLPLGQLLTFNDSTGEQRAACLITKNLTMYLPLLVWLHPSLAPRNSIAATGLLQATTTADLTNDASELGYHLLVISGRSTPHFYPFPDNVGLGWDNWYRNYNRSDPEINVDVQTIDYFIKNAKSVAVVDLKRVFMSGWSNGAAMAVEYGLNTPNIAAVAAYSAPDPYRDINDTCPQTPYPPYLTPFKILYNECDVLGICTSGGAFIKNLTNRYPELIAIYTVVNTLQTQDVSPPMCINSTTICAGIYPGIFNHLRWPFLLNQELFDFLKSYVSA